MMNLLLKLKKRKALINELEWKLYSIKLKKRKAVSTLKETIMAKFFRERLRVKMSLMAMDIPIPSIGPIRGEISMAPITTAVEFALRRLLVCFPPDIQKVFKKGYDAAQQALEILFNLLTLFLGYLIGLLLCRLLDFFLPLLLRVHAVLICCFHKSR